MQNEVLPLHSLVSQSAFILKEVEKPDHLMVILFGQSSSSNYDIAVHLTQTCNSAMIKLNNKNFHAVAISSKREDLTRGLILLKLMMSWKSCYVFVKNQSLINAASAYQTLECFLQSEGQPEHCISYFRNKNGIYRIPCQRLTPRFEFEVLDDTLVGEHLHSVDYLKNRLNRVANQESCNWCPHYNPEGFARLDK